METVRIGFWMRLVAALIDAVVVAVLIWVPTMLLGAIHPSLGMVVGELLALGYASLEFFNGRAIGKTVFKYKITAQDGSNATRDQLLKRYAYKQIPQVLGIVAAIPMLGFVTFVGGVAAIGIAVGTLMALKPEHLAFHDKLFGTAVYGPSKGSFSIPTVADVLPAHAGVQQTAKAA